MFIVIPSCLFLLYEVNEYSPPRAQIVATSDGNWRRRPIILFSATRRSQVVTSAKTIDCISNDDILDIAFQPILRLYCLFSSRHLQVHDRTILFPTGNVAIEMECHSKRLDMIIISHPRCLHPRQGIRRLTRNLEIWNSKDY